MKSSIRLKGLLAAVMSIGTYLFGGFDMAMRALIAAIVLDYATGLMCAYVTRSLNSAVGAKGIAKKFMYLAVVALANIVDRVFGETGLIRNAAIYLFLANEGLSITENAARLGIPIAGPLKDKLEQLTRKDGGDDTVRKDN
jgi:toxin secretion/phage lysis holin